MSLIMNVRFVAFQTRLKDFFLRTNALAYLSKLALTKKKVFNTDTR
jgi:hypothetical protein